MFYFNLQNVPIETPTDQPLKNSETLDVFA